MQTGLLLSRLLAVLCDDDHRMIAILLLAILLDTSATAIYVALQGPLLRAAKLAFPELLARSL